MPLPIPQNQGSSNDDITYPLDLMNEVALTIFQQTQQAMETHQQNWQVIAQWIEESAPKFSQLGINLVDVRSYLKNVLEPHAQRLQASYQWQMDAAQALVNAVEQIQTAEQQIADGFTQSSGSSGGDQHPRGHGSLR
ncbi:MAG TPA: hypothetical protein VFV38_24410 [Ktedonobacteraceae bacterium]|nr:hypothetical protein [Ktedonobacteraceae bacterium]